MRIEQSFGRWSMPDRLVLRNYQIMESYKNTHSSVWRKRLFLCVPKRRRRRGLFLSLSLNGYRILFHENWMNAIGWCTRADWLCLRITQVVISMKLKDFKTLFDIIIIKIVFPLLLSFLFLPILTELFLIHEIQPLISTI